MKTPVLVTALVLTLALGSSAGYAAAKLPKNSVGAKQIKKAAVTAPKIRPGAVTGAAVADRSLTAADLAPGTLPPAVRPGTLRVLGADFRPTSSTVGFDLVNYGGLTVTGATFVQAHLPLPPGASATSVRVRIHDEGPNDVLAFVRREVMASQQFADGPNVVTSGAGGGTTVTPTVPAALSASDDLIVYVLLPAGGLYRVYGVEVDYA